MPLLTRLYGPEAFALQSLFLQVMGLVWIVQTMRLEYFISLPKDDNDALHLLLWLFVRGLFATLILTVIAILWGEKGSAMLGSRSLQHWLPWAPFTGFLYALSLAIEHYKQRSGGFKLSGAAEICNKCAYMLTAFVGSIATGPGGLILATGVGTIFKIGVLLGSGRQHLKDGIKARRRMPAWSEIKPVLSGYRTLSRVTVVSHLVQTIASCVPIFYITWQYGSGELGQFVLVNSTIGLPILLIGSAIGKVYYQRAAASWANGESIKELWVATFRQLLMLGMPLFVGVAVLSPRAYPLIFGADWELAGTIAAFMAVPSAVSFLSSPLDRGVLIANASRYILVSNIGRAVGACAIVLLSIGMNLGFLAFVGLHCLQMTIVYLTDLVYNRHLAYRGPLKP